MKKIYLISVEEEIVKAFSSKKQAIQFVQNTYLRDHEVEYGQDNDDDNIAWYIRVKNPDGNYYYRSIDIFLETIEYEEENND